jgi:hypothetical protein
MFWRTLVLGAVGMASVLGTSLVMSEPASARPACMYIARDPMGNIMADGHAWAIKKSWACNRAQRRCNRELERKRRQGKAGRGHCARVSNY